MSSGGGEGKVPEIERGGSFPKVIAGSRCGRPTES